MRLCVKDLDEAVLDMLLSYFRTLKLLPGILCDCIADTIHVLYSLSKNLNIKKIYTLKLIQ